MKSNVRTLKWISGGYEAFLGIPILGGSIVIGFGYVPLFIALILHIITLVMAKKAGVSANGNIFGIITSCLAWIPIVGMFLHILSAIFILIGAAIQRSR
ncbi:hypothetical protein [Bacillus sp. EAC]|uniref:hypothetical protein n=1 Tax=Bacillus sp. EAC TaxID=1978338 RepID=UPI000B447F7C|nr:hypothetical protein [Bacillus sp. EAC]